MSTKLYIRNLGNLVDSSELEDMFTTVGEVKSAVVEVVETTSSPRRVGYVQMATEQEARDGIDRFNGQEQDGLILIVTKDEPHTPIIAVPKTKARRQSEKSRARA